ncbi:hypothetical protein Hdeb2414_s0488g00904121 [Helianthus debilis subsp. tardiflorus]
MLLESTTSKIQQLQKAFAELESQRAVMLNLKWKQIEEHFHGLEKSLKRRFTELEDQEKEFEMKTMQAQKGFRRNETWCGDCNLEALKKNKNVHVECESKSESGTVISEKPVDAVLRKVKLLVGKRLVENDDVKSLMNPQLAKFCVEMDASGLHKRSRDPGGLVLDSLNGFYIAEGSNLDVKKDSNLLGLRRTCIMLMECLSVLLANLDASAVTKVITEDVKNKAKGIAQEWKPKLDDLDLDASNGNSLEAHAFLQLVATFGIDSDSIHEDLSKLIPMVSRRHQAADLCRFLGLSDKMPGCYFLLFLKFFIFDIIILTHLIFYI